MQRFIGLELPLSFWGFASEADLLGYNVGSIAEKNRGKELTATSSRKKEGELLRR